MTVKGTRRKAVNAEHVANIKAVYAEASDADRHAGAYWYASAHDFSVGLASRHNVPEDVAAAVVAILSPRISWTLNQLNAEAVLEERTAPTFWRSLAKCLSIIDAGTPYVGYAFDGSTYGTSVNGPKVSRFYLTILSDGAHDVVVVDRHAIDIAEGRRGVSDSRNLDTESQYQPWEDAYRQAAAELGILPHVLQATTWISWRRRHGIVDSYTEMEDF